MNKLTQYYILCKIIKYHKIDDPNYFDELDNKVKQDIDDIAFLKEKIKHLK